jgi:phosphatidylglycerophosphate synthase
VGTWLFVALLIAFVILIELSQSLVRAEQERAGIEPASRRRRQLIALGWYGALFVAVVGYSIGIEVARYLLGFLFVAAGVGAALSLLYWIAEAGRWTKGRTRKPN